MADTEEVTDPQTEPPTGISGVLTNRWNLIEFLSRRLITPAGSFPKYYRDLMELTPGRVPVVSTPLSEELVAFTGDDDPETVFPAFLELGNTATGARAVIRLADVVAIHFRSESELAEHQARDFANVPPGPPCKVTPTHFSGGDQTPDDIASTVEEEEHESLLLRLAEADRYTGAVALAVHESVGDGSTAALFRELLGGTAESAEIAPWLGDSALRARGAEADPPEDPGRALFASVERKVMAAPGTVADRLAFADELLEEFGDDEHLAPGLRKVVEILDGEAEFRPFGERGHSVVKALLLFLMRPNPDDLIAWDPSQTGADEMTRITSLFLCGLQHGRRVLDLQLRPDRLDIALADLEAALAQRAPLPDVAAVETAGTWSITVDGETVIDLEPPAPSLTDLIDRSDLSRSRAAAACAAFAAANDWTDIVTTVLAVPDGFNLAAGGKHIEVPGIPKSSTRVDGERLLERLRESTPTPDSVEKLRKALEPKPKRAAGRDRSDEG